MTIKVSRKIRKTDKYKQRMHTRSWERHFFVTMVAVQAANNQASDRSPVFTETD
jgi:hypothetical protein